MFVLIIFAAANRRASAWRLVAYGQAARVYVIYFPAHCVWGVTNMSLRDNLVSEICNYVSEIYKRAQCQQMPNLVRSEDISPTSAYDI